MSRNKNAYLLAMQAKRAREDKEMRYVTWFVTKQQTMDKVIITLGELGFDKDFMRKFKDTYEKVDTEFCTEVIEDANVDSDREYSKDKIDRVLKQYVPEDLFQPYEERYKCD